MYTQTHANDGTQGTILLLSSNFNTARVFAAWVFYKNLMYAGNICSHAIHLFVSSDFQAHYVKCKSIFQIYFQTVRTFHSKHLFNYFNNTMELALQVEHSILKTSFHLKISFIELIFFEIYRQMCPQCVMQHIIIVNEHQLFNDILRWSLFSILFSNQQKQALNGFGEFLQD